MTESEVTVNDSVVVINVTGKPYNYSVASRMFTVPPASEMESYQIPHDHMHPVRMFHLSPMGGLHIVMRGEGESFNAAVKRAHVEAPKRASDVLAEARAAALAAKEAAPPAPVVEAAPATPAPVVLSSAANFKPLKAWSRPAKRTAEEPTET